MEGLIRWKIVDGNGHEDHGYEGERWESREEALDVCNYLHEKYDIDTGEDYGVYSPWFVPELDGGFTLTDEFQVVRFTKEQPS